MNKRLFWALSLTWGLPLTVCGLLTAAVLRLCGVRPTRYHTCLCFEVGRSRWGGLDLGPVTLTQKGVPDRLRRHELGHAIQNARYGPIMPLFALASVARYHHRRRQARKGRPLPPYDAWWFEGQATRLGTALVIREGR